MIRKTANNRYESSQTSSVFPCAMTLLFRKWTSWSVVQWKIKDISRVSMALRLQFHASSVARRLGIFRLDIRYIAYILVRCVIFLWEARIFLSKFSCSDVNQYDYVYLSSSFANSRLSFTKILQFIGLGRIVSFSRMQMKQRIYMWVECFDIKLKMLSLVIQLEITP